MKCFVISKGISLQLQFKFFGFNFNFNSTFTDPFQILFEFLSTFQFKSTFGRFNFLENSCIQNGANPFKKLHLNFCKLKRIHRTHYTLSESQAVVHCSAPLCGAPFACCTPHGASNVPLRYKSLKRYCPNEFTVEYILYKYEFNHNNFQYIAIIS